MSQTIYYTSNQQQQLPSHDTPQPQHRPSTSRSPNRSQPERPPNERSSLSFDRFGQPRNYGSTPHNGHNDTKPTTTNDNSRRSTSPTDTNSHESDTGSVGTFTNSGSNHGADRRTGKAQVKEELSWVRTWLSQFWTLELENKGSVARDHLALERTFLAWLRTSLAFASIGVAITQLFRLNAAIISEDRRKDADSLQKLGKPLGGCFIGLAILSLLCGVHRYYEAQGWLIKGKYPASRGGVLLLSLVALIMVIASLVIVLALGSQQV